jgi:hypothetical protein
MTGLGQAIPPLAPIHFNFRSLAPFTVRIKTIMKPFEV